MKFSTRSEYGLRAVIELGRHWGGPPVSIQKVAAETGVPYQYLEQLAQKLKRAGLVVAQRGVRGGYTLSKAPNEISVGDVFRSLEGDLAPYRCPSVGPYRCPYSEKCKGSRVWGEIARAVNQTVNGIMIEGLL